MDLIHDDGSILNKGSGIVTPHLKHLEAGGCEVIEDTSICAEKCLFCASPRKLARMEVQRRESALRGLKIKVFSHELGDLNIDDQSDDNFSLITYREFSGFNGWTFPVISGKKYNLHFGTGKEFTNIYLGNNPYWDADFNVHLTFNITNAPELFDVKYTGLEGSTYVTDKLYAQDEALTQNSKFAVYYWGTESKILDFKLSGAE